MVNYVLTYVKSLIKDERGQGMVEYGLILALIAVAVVTILGTMGDNLETMFTTVSDELVE